MSYTRKAITRDRSEIIFLFFFILATVLAYTFLKWPVLMVDLGIINDQASTYFLGKSPSFWYATVYTLLVCTIAVTVIFSKKSPYNPAPNATTSEYQRGKFSAIFLSQLIFFYTLPYIVPALMQSGGFFADPISLPKKMAHVYISPAFTSWFWAFWIFLLIPIVVYLFGKRYCSWFCSCGNLAESIGVTKWGVKWVRHQTPSGDTAKKLEILQLITMILGFVIGFSILVNTLKIINATDFVSAAIFYQDLVIDFIFGSIVGVGLYPFLGTRIWCRYGCPLAKFMELLGRYGKSRFKVQANSNCKGLSLCSAQCPMGIDVASFAHKDKKPTLGSFSLSETLCIGCGGCIERCPTSALAFVSPFKKDN